MGRLLDLVYGAALTVASPVVGARLVATGKWRTDWRARFGHVGSLSVGGPRVLVHGVSVGEVNATRRLVEALASVAPGRPPVVPVVSATTDTGTARAKALYDPRYPVVRYPLDFTWMVERFLDVIEPRAVALVELELWPNFVGACTARGVPVSVVNGRLSDSSFAGYRRVRPLVAPMFGALRVAAVQNETYAERFAALGTPPERIVVTDTMKWDTASLGDDVPGSSALAEALGIDRSRPLVVAGSTGPGEEAPLVAARPPGVQLLIAPRKPERFEEVAALGPFVRRSQSPDGMRRDVGADLFLLDTIGDLSRAYALAEVALVGRSFQYRGGSDPIDPIALGVPAVIGPHHEHFVEVVAAFRDEGGIVVSDRPMEEAGALLADPERRARLRERGRAVIRRHQGATRRHVDLIQALVAGDDPVEAARGGPV